MRVCVLILAFGLALVYEGCGRAEFDAAAPVLSSLGAHESASPNPAGAARVDFDKEVRPLLESKCTPCHFKGGTMYERLPFDRAETVTKLGTRLFTRIKDEKEQRLIRDFLAQQAEQNRERP